MFTQTKETRAIFFEEKVTDPEGRLRAQFMADLRAGGLETVLGVLESGSKKVVRFRYHAGQQLYIVMVECRSDAELLEYGRKYLFPRGLPILWKPGQWMDCRGFYPKFANDGPGVGEGAEELCFFKKWSGFLVHVLAFRGEDGEDYWTVCSKNSADPESPYVQWGAEMVAAHMEAEPELVKRLASERLYVGGEAMHPDDTHGYIAKRRALVITCMGKGTWVDLTAGHAPKRGLMEYWSLEAIARFCKANGLLCDAVVRRVGGVDAFVGALLNRRDFLRNGAVDALLGGGGSADHDAIVGDVLEGFVFKLKLRDGREEMVKVKLPYYTWRTMFLRPLVEDAWAGDWRGAQGAIAKYTKRWCSSEEGRAHFTQLLKSATMLLKEKGLGAPCGRKRLHVYIADLAEGLRAEEMAAKSAAFDALAAGGREALCVCFCLGPVGCGKSVVMEILARMLKGKGRAIDGDRVATDGYTEQLGVERNAVTKTHVYMALMAGEIPIVSQGGGVFCKESVCTFREDIRCTFGKECKMVVVLPEQREGGRVEEVDGPRSWDVEWGYLEALVQRRGKGTAKSYSETSKRNEAFVRAICEEADKVFSVPYSVLGEHSLFKGVQNMQVITKELYASGGGVWPRFEEVRAIVVGPEGRKHVTLAWEREWNPEFGSLVGHGVFGQRFSAKLRSEDGTVSEVMVDRMPALDGWMGGRHAHVTVAAGCFAAKDSVKVMEHLMRKKEGKLTLESKGKSPKTFVFEGRVESQVVPRIGANGQPVPNKTMVVAGNYSGGTTLVVYKCVALGAGRHADFEPPLMKKK